MACSEQRVVAYLAGDLDPDAASSFERHLLSCEDCWTAVRDDRRGRELTEQLRELAPAGLRDRVRASVELSAGAHRVTPRRRPWRTIIAAAAAVVVVAGGGAFVELHHGNDPAVVTDVLAMASRTTPAKPSAHTYDGQRVEISMLEMHGQPVVLARSDRTFPMPDNAMPLGTAHGEPWMAHRHDMTLLSLGHPYHALLAGRMPPADLLAFARSLGLAP
jgi:anti-sigma factor RsiW